MVVREALRTAMVANHDAVPVPADALAVLDDTAERARLTADRRWIAEPQADGVDVPGCARGDRGRRDADGTWSRLKVCVNDACRWGFHDTSRARSGKWGSMQPCDNRAKQQAWRARH